MLAGQHLLENPRKSRLCLRILGIEQDFGRSTFRLDELGFKGCEIDFLFLAGGLLVLRQAGAEPVLNPDAKRPAIVGCGRSDLKLTYGQNVT